MYPSISSSTRTTIPIETLSSTQPSSPIELINTLQAQAGSPPIPFARLNPIPIPSRPEVQEYSPHNPHLNQPSPVSHSSSFPNNILPQVLLIHPSPSSTRVSLPSPDSIASDSLIYPAPNQDDIDSFTKILSDPTLYRQLSNSIVNDFTLRNSLAQIAYSGLETISLEASIHQLNQFLAAKRLVRNELIKNTLSFTQLWPVLLNIHPEFPQLSSTSSPLHQ